ncbi:MAG: saccharopine dehydrogenase family protein [Gemmatimonadales bacterium]
MKMLVLGAGLQGTACAFDILENSDYSVTLADTATAGLPDFLAAHDGERLTRIVLDVRDEAGVREVFREHDAVQSAIPYYFNDTLAGIAVEAGVHFADLGGNTEIVWRQKELHERAIAGEVSITPDCGLAPGMVNVLAAECIRRFDETESVKMFVGGLPANPEPPLNYQIVYSLEGALDYYTTESWIVREGKPSTIDALSELEEVVFEELGVLEAFHTAGGLSTMPWDYEGRVDSMEYKTLRYPGHAAIMRVIRDLGLLSNDPIDVRGTAVAPRDVFIAAVDPVLRKPGSPDVVALKVVGTGRNDGDPASIEFELVDHYDDRLGISAMMRVTGFSLAITGLMQLDGRIGEAGVRTAAECTPFDDYVGELAARGIAIVEK